MSDSSEMTIEFLRARLLSERAVSRAAKERADQLAQKVVELEEQLRLVNLQRKKAEMAALEAVSILQTQGVDDGSEVIDSCSEKDESPVNEQDSEEASADSRVGRSKLDDAMLSSETRVLPSKAGGLSWKSRSSSPDSHRRQRGKQFSQREKQTGLTSSFEPTAKYNVGKSGRKIKHNDMGSINGDERHNNHELGEGFSKSDLADNQHDLLGEISGNESGPHISAIGTTKDEEMDRVLKQQAQFISQYEEEEKAQREWERKYNENKNLALDHSGDQSSIAADNNIDHQKDSVSPSDLIPNSLGVLTINGEPTDGMLSDAPLPKASGKADVRNTARNPDENADTSSNGFGPTDSTKTTNGKVSGAFRDALRGQTGNAVAVDKTEASYNVSARGKTYLGSDGKHNKYLAPDHSDSSSSIGFGAHMNHDQMLGLPLTGRPLTANHSRDPAKLVSSVSNDGSFNQQSQTPGGHLGDVLEALQRAKMSLKQELRKPILPNQSLITSAASTDSRAVQNSAEPASLFRLPADNLPPQNSLKHDVYRAGVSLSSRYSPLPFHTPGSESPFMSYNENTSGNFLGRRQFDNHSDSSRSSLPYLSSAADKSRTPFRSLTGSSLGKQEYSAPSDAVGVSSSRYSLPYSDLTRDVASFPREFGSLRHNQPFDSYIGFHESTFNMYSPPYLGSTERARFHHGTPNYQK